MKTVRIGPPRTARWLWRSISAVTGITAKPVAIPAVISVLPSAWPRHQLGATLQHANAKELRIKAKELTERVFQCINGSIMLHILWLYPGIAGYIKEILSYLVIAQRIIIHLIKYSLLIRFIFWQGWRSILNITSDKRWLILVLYIKHRMSLDPLQILLSTVYF